MKRLLSLLLLCTSLFAGPAAAENLEGVLPLTKDDIAAVAQIRGTPERHVMLYFGDHIN